jgi:hypothetical protein
MSDPEGFSEQLALAEERTEVDIAVAVAWFLSERAGSAPFLAEVVEFIQSNGIRHNLNKSRLGDKIQKDKRTSAPKGKPISIRPSVKKELAEKFSAFLAAPTPEVQSWILQHNDFATARGYVKALIDQINGTHQFGFFDACAVMMRRLAEVLVIDAFVDRGNDALIRDSNGDCLMFKGLVRVLKSGTEYRLSRNAPAYLDALKLLGDTAAHSRTYITKKKDIDDFSHRYRMLIEELSSLNH